MTTFEAPDSATVGECLTLGGHDGDPCSKCGRTRPPRVPWIWEVIPGYLESAEFRWVVKNQIMRDDATGVTIRYRPRQNDDVICGARTLHPGYPKAARGFTWRPDPREPYEAACTILGTHTEVPHVGVPAECADMTCRCAEYGSYHLVIESLTIARAAGNDVR